MTLLQLLLWASLAVVVVVVVVVSITTAATTTTGTINVEYYYNSWARPRGAQLTAGYTVNTV